MSLVWCANLFCTYQEAAEMPLCSLCLCVLCVRSNRRTARVDAMQAYSRGFLEHRAHRGTENTEKEMEQKNGRERNLAASRNTPFSLSRKQCGHGCDKYRNFERPTLVWCVIQFCTYPALRASAALAG